MDDQMTCPNQRNPFTDPSAPTMHDVLVRVLADSELPPRRQREMASAIRSLGHWFNADLIALPANFEFLRRRFERFHPVHADVSKRRVANVRSLVTAALHCGGIATNRRTYLAPMSTAWQALYDRLPESNTRAGLARFFRYCSANGIEPVAVDDTISARFLGHLTTEGLTRHPRTAHQTAVRLWNRCLDGIEQWPAIRLTKPLYNQSYGLPWGAFPVSLRRDVVTYRQRLALTDPLAEHAPRRALRPRSIETRLMQIRAFASALVRRGHEPSAIRSFTYLTDLDHFKDGLRFFLDRKDAAPNSNWVAEIAWTITAIARHHLRVTESQLRPMLAIVHRLRKPRRGMSDRNKKRLKQFNDPRNVARILWFGRNTLERVEAVKSPSAVDALKAQIAIAVELLIYAPMRSSNLANLSLERHITFDRSKRKGLAHISIPADEVKNDEALDYELPRHVATMLRIYVNKYRPMLTRASSEWLFPIRDGRCKRADTLSKQISRTLWNDLGLEVHAHLFRHLGAMLLLRRKPGYYELVRRVLKHRSADTTFLFYSGEEDVSATRHFDQVILEIADELGGGGNRP